MFCIYFTFFIILDVLLRVSSANLESLNTLFKYYQYEITDEKNWNHKIKRRSIEQDVDHRTFDFHFKKKKFEIHMQRSSSILSPDFKAFELDENDASHEINFNNNNLHQYHGVVRGLEKTSKASLLYKSGDVLDSIIVSTENETYYMEPLSHYIRGDDADVQKKWITYSASSLKTFGNRNNNEKDKKPNVFCSAADADDDDDEKISSHRTQHKEATEHRNKRATLECSSNKYKICPLYLVADASFYKTVGNSNTGVTMMTMISLIDQMNEIYKQHTFGECGRGFGFQINRLLVHKNHSKSLDHYNHESAADGNPSHFLKLFGNRKYSDGLKDHCLGHLFTAHSMKNDTLGLTNVADSHISLTGSVNSGGICSTNLFSGQVYTNTGFTTFRNSYVERIASLQAALVIAHGHSFGSHHDPKDDEKRGKKDKCSDERNSGNYLMYPIAVSGYEPNHKKFSNCSIGEITSVLRKKAKLCFIEDKKSFCGNFKVEDGEQCDEGLLASSRLCCDNQCQLNGNASCSTFNDECCMECQYATTKVSCRSADQCHQQAFCSGHNAVCPDSEPKNDGGKCTTSNGAEGFCKGGQCVHVCEFNNLESCLCNKPWSCNLCCRNVTDDSHTCESFYEHPRTNPDGFACDGGLCSKGRCRATGSSPIQRLWSIIIFKDISEFVVFVKNNIVGLVIIISLLFWIPGCCLISYIDRKRMREEKEMLEWLSNSNHELVVEKENLSIRESNEIKSSMTLRNLKFKKRN